jgi:hypothetical protein
VARTSRDLFAAPAAEDDMKRRAQKAAVILIAILLVASQRTNAESKDALKGVTQLGILIEELDQQSQRIGVRSALLESQALVAVKRDMPKMTVQNISDASTYIYISLIALPTTDEGSAVTVLVELKRPVFVSTGENTPSLIIATVWEKEALLTGRNSGMESRITADINEKITLLAAAYYRANP